MVKITAINGIPAGWLDNKKYTGSAQETNTHQTGETEHAALESRVFSIETALNTPGFSEFLAGFPDAESLNMDSEDETVIKERYEAFNQIPETGKKLGEILQAKILKDTKIKLKPEQLKSLEKGLMEKVQQEGVEAIQALRKELSDYEKLPAEIQAKRQQLASMEPEGQLEERLAESKNSLEGARETKTLLDSEAYAFNAIVRGEKALRNFSAEFKKVEKEMQKAGLESVKQVKENAGQYSELFEVLEKRAEVLLEAGVDVAELQKQVQVAKNGVEVATKLDTEKNFSMQVAAEAMKNLDQEIYEVWDLSEALVDDGRKDINKQLGHLDYTKPESAEEAQRLNEKLDKLRKLSLRRFDGLPRVSGPDSVWNSFEDAYKLKASIDYVLRNPADIARIKDLNDSANKDDIGFGYLQSFFKKVSQEAGRIEADYRRNDVEKGAALYRQTRDFSSKGLITRSWARFKKQSPDQRRKSAMTKAEAELSESLSKVAGLEKKLENLQDTTQQKAAMELKFKSITQYLFNEAAETKQVLAEVRTEFRENLQVLVKPDASLDKALKAWENLEASLEEADNSGVEYFDSGEDYGGGREYTQLAIDSKELIMIILGREMHNGFKEMKPGSTTVEKVKLKMMSIERALGPELASGSKYREVRNAVLEELIRDYQKGATPKPALAIVLKAYRAKL